MKLNPLALAESAPPMPIYAAGELDDGVDHGAIAQEIDSEALARAAAVESTIASVGEISGSLLRESMERGEFSTEDEAIIRNRLESIQRDRMRLIHGDTSAKAGNLGPGILGLSDGKGVWLNPNGGITNAVYRHERQHVRDGIVGDIDAPLAKKTGIAAIDERLQGIGTGRDILEERAMDAQKGEELSDLYIRTHWAKVKALEKRGRNTGVDFEAASSGLIENRNEDGFQENLVRIAVTEAAKEGPEALADIQQEAIENGVDDTVMEIIAEVREDFEKGPKANAAKPQERLVSLAV
jgi:hypothetical protein